MVIVFLNQEKNYSLFSMPYESIRQFKTSSPRNSKFPHQKNIQTYKPLLEEVFSEMKKT